MPTIKFDPRSFGQFKTSLDAASRAIEDFAKANRHVPKQIIMHPADTGRLRESIKAELQAGYSRTGSLFGVEVVESTFIEPGTAYIMKKSSYGLPPLPFQYELELERRIEHFMHAFYARPNPFPGIRNNLWKRKDKESLVQWGNRLEKLGLLDNPEYRWEYQKTCLKTAIRIPIDLLMKVIEVFHD